MNSIDINTLGHEPHLLSSSPPREASDTLHPGLAASLPYAHCELIFEHLDQSYLTKFCGFISAYQPTPGWVWKRSDAEEDPLGRFKVLARCLYTPIHAVRHAPNDTHCFFRMTCFAQVGHDGEPLCGPGGELTALLDRFPDLKISGRLESLTGGGTIHGFELTPDVPAPTGNHKSPEKHSSRREHLAKLPNLELQTIIEDITAEGEETPEKEAELLEAAELLVELTDDVDFCSVGRLSTKLAEILARVDRLALIINDDLHEEAALHLAKCPGELDLSGFPWLSEEVAEAFGDRVGMLILNDITSLSLPAARALSKHRGYLELDAIRCAPPDVIRALGQHKGSTVLKNLCEIPDSAAAGFAFHVGDLRLHNLAKISLHLAQCLATNDGGLYLDSLTTLSEEIAETLSHHCGELRLWGLRSLSDEACKHLGRHKGNLIFGRELNHVSVDGLKALAANGGDLHLDGLKTLCPEGAAALAKHRGALHLGGLTELDSGIAEIISSHDGPLSFSGVKNLCPAAARALSRHRGELRLKGLETLAYPTAGFLESHSGPIYLGKALKDSPDVAVHWSCSTTATSCPS